MGRLAAALALALWFSPAVALPPESETWRALDTPSFALLGNAAAPELVTVARNLESLKAVLARTGGGVSGPRIPVLVFGSVSSFAPYRGALGKGTDNVIGFFTERGGDRFIALTVATGASEFPTVYHEYLHSVVRRRFGRVPLWFNEGIAGLYETFSCKGTEAVVGKAPREHLRFLANHPWIPLQQLMALGDATDLHEKDDDTTASFYAQSWLLVHDLFYGHPERRKELAAFLQAYARGVPHDEAFEGSFRGGIAGVEAEIREYLKGTLPYVTVTFGELDVPAAGSVRIVPRTEALLALGRLLVTMSGSSTAEAARHFEAALALAPEDPRVGAGLGLVAFREGRKDDAAARLDEAADAGLDDPAALGVAGRLAYSRDDRARARDLAARALATSPEDADLLALYGVTFLGESGDVAQGIAALERADQLEPDRADVLAGLVALHAQAGDRTKAEASARRAESRGEPALSERVRESLVRLDLDESDAAVGAGDYPRAIALLRAARDRTAREELKEKIGGYILELELAASKKKPPAKR